MLVKAQKEDIEQYMEFAYSLALDQTRSGYPLFSDGISTKEQFVDHVWKSYDNDDRDILLFVIDGLVEGWIQYFYIEQDRYLQTNGFLINRNTEQALTEFLEYAETIFIFDDAVIQPETAGIVKVTESNFSEFRKIYRTDPDTYLSSERIFSTLNEWRIYLLYRNNIAAGYVCARDDEIFGLGYQDDIFDKNTYKTLVTVILSDFKAAGCRDMTFFNDEESQSAALDIGFVCVSEYLLYVKSI